MSGTFVPVHDGNLMSVILAGSDFFFFFSEISNFLIFVLAIFCLAKKNCYYFLQFFLYFV